MAFALTIGITSSTRADMRTAVQAGLLDLALQAVDGMKVQGCVAKDGLREAKGLMAPLRVHLFLLFQGIFESATKIGSSRKQRDLQPLSVGNPFHSTVDVETVLLGEPDQRYVKLLCQLYSQGRRSAHGHDHGDAGNSRLLY